LASPSLILLNDEERPRLLRSGTEGDVGDRIPKKILGDHWDFSDLGESDRADRFFWRNIGEVFKRGSDGVGGGCRGVMNLSAGFIDLRSPFAISLIDALRNRSG
jgi:hypothetical protein